MLIAGMVLVDVIVIVLLARIATVDFTTEKISNRDVLTLAAIAAIALVLKALWRIDQLQSGVWWNVWLSVGAGALLFVVLLPFWMMGKLGAGDVKLMAAAPLVAGAEGLMVFALLLLVFAALTAFAIRYPLLLPAPLFRQYLEHFERKGVVPYGVPIAFALIGTVLLRAALMIAQI